MSEIEFARFTRSQEVFAVQLTEENAVEVAKYFGWQVDFRNSPPTVSRSGYRVEYGAWFSDHGSEHFDPECGGWEQDGEVAR